MTDAPEDIRIRTRSRVLELHYPDGTLRQLPFEYLRVYSPSAEVQGHGPGPSILQTGKQDVMITHAEPTGNYGLRLYFDDGHDTGIYTWTYLKELHEHYDTYWDAYLQRLENEGGSRSHP